MPLGVELGFLFSPMGANFGVGCECRDIHDIYLLYVYLFLEATFVFEYLADFFDILIVLLRG